MSIADYALLTLVGILAAAAVRFLVKKKGAGCCGNCTGNCAACRTCKKK